MPKPVTSEILRYLCFFDIFVISLCTLLEVLEVYDISRSATSAVRRCPSHQAAKTNPAAVNALLGMVQPARSQRSLDLDVLTRVDVSRSRIHPGFIPTHVGHSQTTWIT